VTPAQNIQLARAVLERVAPDVVARLRSIAETGEKPADRREALKVLRMYGIDPLPASGEGSRRDLHGGGGSLDAGPSCRA
jgi:hypothetical protein